MTKLTNTERKELPKGNFVFPKTRRYPIEDAAHARDALARSSGKPEHAAVVTAVRRKYPEIDIEKKKSQESRTERPCPKDLRGSAISGGNERQTGGVRLKASAQSPLDRAFFS